MKSLLLFTVLCMLSFSVTAQDKNEFTREGFIFGMSAGFGKIKLKFPTETQSDTDLALNWKIGYTLNSKLAVLLNGSVSIYEYDLSDRKRLRDFGGVFLSAQYFLSDKMWVLGGVGVGTDAPVFYDLETEESIETEYYTGVGVVSGIGYEFHRKRNHAFDIQTRFNFSNVDLPIGETSGVTMAILLGITYY